MNQSKQNNLALYAAPAPTEDSISSLGEWLDVWLATYKACQVSKRTVEIYRSVIALLQPYPAAKKPLEAVSEIDLQLLLNDLFVRGYSKSTITKIRYTLRQRFRPLIRQHILRDDPSAFLELPNAPTKKILPLTLEEQEKVEDVCQMLPLGHLIIFLLRTGLRRAEMAGLQWEDYDAQNGSIFIRKSKTAAGIRTVYLLEEAQTIIEAQPRINQYIFNNTQENPIQPITWRRLCEHIGQETGIHLTPHMCRHTFVTRLCEKGVPAKAIAQIIGHAKADYVLDIYAQLEQQELRKAIYTLEERRQIPARGRAS